MTHEPWEVLEQRITDVAEQFRRARDDNAKLVAENAALRASLHEREREIGGLKDALSGYKRDRDVVHTRVKALIERLDALG